MAGMEGGEDGLPTRYRFVPWHPDSLTCCSLLCGSKILSRFLAGLFLRGGKEKQLSSFILSRHGAINICRISSPDAQENDLTRQRSARGLPMGDDVNPELVEKMPNNFYEQQFGFGDAESEQDEGSDDFRNMVCSPSWISPCDGNFVSSLFSLFACMHAHINI
jgi:hypothetical protein